VAQEEFVEYIDGGLELIYETFGLVEEGGLMDALEFAAPLSIEGESGGVLIQKQRLLRNHIVRGRDVFTFAKLQRFACDLSQAFSTYYSPVRSAGFCFLSRKGGRISPGSSYGFLIAIDE
jgi:hypothetical protein